MPRTTPGIQNKEVNPVYRAVSNVSSYVGNVGKEIKDTYNAWSKANEMSNTVGPGTDAEANRLRGVQSKEMGQLAGAVLKGAKYDSKGKRIN